MVQFQIGFAILRIAHITSKHAGHDGWISVLAAGIFVQIMILILWLIMKRYPEQDLFQISEKLLGKIGGKIITFVCILYFLLLILYLMTELTRLIHTWVLPLTPQWALLIFPVFCTCYLAIEPARVLARFMTVTFLLILLPIVMTLFPMTHAEFLYLLPIGEAGVIPILKGAKDSLLGLIGFEAMFVMFALSQGTHKQKLGIISAANGFITLTYVIITIGGITVFSPKELAIVPEPTLYMLKAVSFKIIERVDLIFFSAWVVIIICTLAGYAYLLSVAFNRLSGIRRKPIILGIGVISYGINLFTVNPDTLRVISLYSEYASYAAAIGVPLILLIVVPFRKSGEAS
jgi:spore germination protein (amino acid permease)